MQIFGLGSHERILPNLTELRLVVGSLLRHLLRVCLLEARGKQPEAVSSPQIRELVSKPKERCTSVRVLCGLVSCVGYRYATPIELEGIQNNLQPHSRWHVKDFKKSFSPTPWHLKALQKILQPHPVGFDMLHPTHLLRTNPIAGGTPQPCQIYKFVGGR